MSQAEKKEGLKLHLLSCICCPAFSTVVESVEDASLVHCEFSFHSQLVAIHTLLHSLDINAAAFAMHLSISMMKDRLLAIVEPRYVKLSTASSKILSMVIAGGTHTSWPMMLAFVMLIVSPNFLQASATCWSSAVVSLKYGRLVLCCPQKAVLWWWPDRLYSWLKSAWGWKV